MENARLVGLTRQITLRRELDTLANNLANMRTSGFKRDQIMLVESPLDKAKVHDLRGQDAKIRFNLNYATLTDHSSGSMLETGNTFDVAIEGEGFFVIETPQGERYTRNGAFSKNAEGELVTLDGFRVMGQGGPVSFSDQDVDITISRDGTISSGGNSIDVLRVVEFESTSGLRKIGDSLFEGQEPQDIDVPKVIQGYVEGSNVKGITEISKMIEVTRSYELVSNLMRQNDELRDAAVRRLGQVDA